MDTNTVTASDSKNQPGSPAMPLSLPLQQEQERNLAEWDVPESDVPDAWGPPSEGGSWRAGRCVGSELPGPSVPMRSFAIAPDHPLVREWTPLRDEIHSLTFDLTISNPARREIKMLTPLRAIFTRSSAA